MTDNSEVMMNRVKITADQVQSFKQAGAEVQIEYYVVLGEVEKRQTHQFTSDTLMMMKKRGAKLPKEGTGIREAWDYIVDEIFKNDPTKAVPMKKIRQCMEDWGINQANATHLVKEYKLIRPMNGQ